MALLLSTGLAREAGSASDAQKLVARIGPGSRISLTTATGAPAKRLSAGRYAITVRDASPRDNFHLFGAGVNKRTGVAFRGTLAWSVRFTGGQAYTYRSDTHARLRGTFRAVAPTPPPESGPGVVVTGSEEIVYDWSAEHCNGFDLPDAPVRAVRNAQGEVQMYLAFLDNHRLVGPDFDHLRHGCVPAFTSHGNDDPAAFDDSEWLASLYSEDGRTVYALVHMEHHLNIVDQPGYDALTLAVYNDGGRTYQHATPPAQLVASIPDRARYDLFDPFLWQGMSGPSNIVKGKDGYYYAFAAVNENVPPKSLGNCLMRTNDLSDPHAWRGWKQGSGFTVTFVNPYVEDVPASERAAHICDLVGVAVQPQSLTYSTFLERYVLVGEYHPLMEPGGFYFQTSTDLLHWTPPRLISEQLLTNERKCPVFEGGQYPSLIDPESTSLSFETVGENAYLYFSRSRCNDNARDARDLVRLPVRFTK